MTIKQVDFDRLLQLQNGEFNTIKDEMESFQIKELKDAIKTLSAKKIIISYDCPVTKRLS